MKILFIILKDVPHQLKNAINRLKTKLILLN